MTVSVSHSWLNMSLSVIISCVVIFQLKVLPFLVILGLQVRTPESSLASNWYRLHE